MFKRLLVVLMFLLTGANMISASANQEQQPFTPQLTAKKITDFHLYINKEIIYYYTTRKEWTKKKEGKELKGLVNFTEDFIRTDKPTAEMVANAELTRNTLISRLGEEGFTITTEGPCEECLTINMNFGEWRTKQIFVGTVGVSMANFSIYYKNQEVGRTKDSIAVIWKNDAFAKNINVFIDMLFKELKYRLEILGS